MQSDSTLAARFWCKVDRSGDCWLWTAAKSANGYGQFWHGGRQVGAHRMAYELHAGVIATGLNVLHACDVPACVRPDHLRTGTALENSRDMVVRGRSLTGDNHPLRLHPERIARGDRSGPRLHPESMPRGDRNGARLHPESRARGERNANARLNAVLVRELREARATSGDSYAKLAAMYRISKRTAMNIVKRRTWKHIE